MNKIYTSRNSILIILSIIIISCGKEKDIKSEKFCTELPSPIVKGDSNKKGNAFGKPERPDAAAPVSSKWKHSVNFPLNISIRFLNGTEWQKNKVREYAKIWTEVSAYGAVTEPRPGEISDPKKRKIQLNFIPYDITTTGNYSDIRIIFNDGGGSASYVGTDCKQIPQDQPTMFFGWINENETEETIKQVVLHEFGHALGLIHEHQHPGVNIPWNKEKVYEYYYNTQNPPWDKAKVDNNIFKRYNASSTNHSKYDKYSIMHYAIPTSLTKDGFSTPWNTELSKDDIDFIKSEYKFIPCVVNVDCCFDKNGKRIPCP